MGTLLNDLETIDGTIGLETMCVGGGQGMAMLVDELGGTCRRRSSGRQSLASGERLAPLAALSGGLYHRNAAGRVTASDAPEPARAPCFSSNPAPGASAGPGSRAAAPRGAPSSLSGAGWRGLYGM